MKKKGTKARGHGGTKKKAAAKQPLTPAGSPKGRGGKKKTAARKRGARARAAATSPKRTNTGTRRRTADAPASQGKKRARKKAAKKKAAAKKPLTPAGSPEGRGGKKARGVTPRVRARRSFKSVDRLPEDLRRFVRARYFEAGVPYEDLIDEVLARTTPEELHDQLHRRLHTARRSAKDEAGSDGDWRIGYTRARREIHAWLLRQPETKAAVEAGGPAPTLLSSSSVSRDYATAAAFREEMAAVREIFGDAIRDMDTDQAVATGMMVTHRLMMRLNTLLDESAKLTENERRDYHAMLKSAGPLFNALTRAEKLRADHKRLQRQAIDDVERRVRAALKRRPKVLDQIAEVIAELRGEVEA